ncbi:MAG: methionine biosynthesis protein MetW [Candidatus Pacebacteria bacterium]|nr:methionine biosynthesis protein MetW [Candidatus Paceibacterota bacterium]
MSVEKFEDEKWQNKDQAINFRLEVALAMVDKGPVLDLGCGDGIFLKMLQDKGIKGQGLDISDVAVEKAIKRGLAAERFDFSAANLPFADGSFKTVVLLDVLEHLYQPQNILREARRMAGEMVAAVPNFNSLPSRLQMLSGRVPENNLAKKGHIYWFNSKILRKVLKESGWRVTETRTNTFFEHYFLLKNIFVFLAKVFPGLFALSFVVKAKKYE